MMKRTQKSGNLQIGNEQKPAFLQLTQFAGSVEIHLKYPITQTWKSMENLNISTYQAQSPIVTHAIAESMLGVSCAEFVERLQQSWRVRRAMAVLGKAIKQELKKTARVATNPGTEPTEKRTGAVIRKRSSETESGWKCVYPDDCMVKRDNEPPCPTNCGECISLRKP